MKVWVAVVGVVKEGMEPVGVFSIEAKAEACAKRVCNPDFQDWDVFGFELDAEPAADEEKSRG